MGIKNIFSKIKDLVIKEQDLEWDIKDGEVIYLQGMDEETELPPQSPFFGKDGGGDEIRRRESA